MIDNSIFSVMAALIVEILFMLTILCDGLKMMENEAYWLTDFTVW